MLLALRASVPVPCVIAVRFATVVLLHQRASPLPIAASACKCKQTSTRSEGTIRAGVIPILFLLLDNVSSITCSLYILYHWSSTFAQVALDNYIVVPPGAGHVWVFGISFTALVRYLSKNKTAAFYYSEIVIVSRDDLHQSTTVYGLTLCSICRGACLTDEWFDKNIRMLINNWFSHSYHCPVEQYRQQLRSIVKSHQSVLSRIIVLLFWITLIWMLCVWLPTAVERLQDCEASHLLCCLVSFSIYGNFQPFVHAAIVVDFCSPTMLYLALVR